MENIRETKKEEVQVEIVILDKGIESETTIGPESLVCCFSSIFPYRYL